MPARPPSDTKPPELPRAVLLQAFLAALAGAVLLAAHAPRFHLDRLNVDDLNDQVGYITTARHWVDTGEFTSHLIYPTFLHQERFRYYMPGHYALLALAYLTCGDHPLTWRLPGMIAFCLSGFAVFLAAARRYGAPAGWIAVVLLYALPASVALGFTAMSEPTTAAAVAVAVALFLSVPARRRPVLLPLVLALPFLFRETTALLVLPLGALVAWGEGRFRPRPALLAVGASVVLLGSLYAWQVADGKTPPPSAWSLEGEPDYASIVESGTEVPLGTRVAAIARNFGRNAVGLARNVSQLLERYWQPSNVLFVLALHVLAVLGGLALRPRDPFAVGVGAAGFAALAAVLALHHAGTAHVTMRHLFWTHPIACVALGGLGSRVARVAGSRLSSPLLRAFPVAVLAAFASIVHWRGVDRVADRIVADEPPAWTRRLEALGHDDRKLLVCSPGIGLDYVLKHYPVRWAFVPDDEATLRALDRRFPIGTIVVQRALLRAGLGGPALTMEGYELVDTVLDGRGHYLVFRKPGEPPPE